MSRWKMCNSSVPSGVRHCGRHQQDGRGHGQEPEDGWGNLSDTIKRGILMKALTNEAELQKHVFRDSTRLSTYEKVREEVMSALTAEWCANRWGTIRWRLEPSARAARRAQARKEKARTIRRVGERAQAKRKAQEPRTPMQIESASRQRGMQNSYGRREGQQEQGRERQEKGQTVQAKGEETNECGGRSRSRKPGNEQQQHQSVKERFRPQSARYKHA